MDNVLFKRGLSTALASATVENGAFYLTTDTHKLYYGFNDKINLLDSVIMVDKLPTNNIEVGYFYYATDDNILAVYDGSAWTQVNPDSSLTITGFESKATLADNTATVETTLTGVDEENSQVLNQSASFSVKGAEGITVSVAGTEITLTGTKYEYDLAVADSDAGAEIALTLNGETDAGAVAIAAGANTEVKAADGTITIGAKDSEVTGVAFSNGANGEGIDFTITSKVTKADGTTEEKTVTDNFNVGIQYNPIVSEDGEVEYMSSAAIEDGILNLNVYSTDVIDSLMIALESKMNAMEFKGAVASEEELNEHTFNLDDLTEVGDTFKASANFTLSDGREVKVGDLIIAEAVKDNPDYTTNDPIVIIEWVIIPSGDETVLTYELGLDANGKIALKENGTEKSAVSIVDEDGNPVQVEINTANKTVKVVHGTKTATASTADAIAQTAGATQEITAVVDVTADVYGHLADVKTQKITVVDTKVTGVTEEVSNTDAGVKIGTSIAQTAGDPITTEYYIESSSLSISEGEANDNKVIVDLVWGSF